MQPADAGRRDFCGRTARLGAGLLLAMTVPAFGGHARASGPGARAAGDGVPAETND
jgi:hypothetical protein